MKFFLDTEFHGYKKKPLFGKPIDTIELISIGIVAEDHPNAVVETYTKHNLREKDEVIKKVFPEAKEYYAICKDFDVKAAWDSFQRDEPTMFEKQNGFKGKKVYWLRENVLKPIYMELLAKALKDEKYLKNHSYSVTTGFNLTNFKNLVNYFGKSREVIAEEIKEFVYNQSDEDRYNDTYKSKPEFYAYYADYDWVVFCWLFGKMIDLPKGFPMYCVDLKQMFDDKAFGMTWNTIKTTEQKHEDVAEWISDIKRLPDYPKQTNEHNALADAKWNKELYKFLNKI